MENADAAAAEQGCGILRNARTNASIPRVVGHESTSRRFMQTARTPRSFLRPRSSSSSFSFFFSPVSNEFRATEFP